MILPEKLKKGDKIGVVAPAGIIRKKDLEDLNNSITLMEASGFEIEFGKYVFNASLGYTNSGKEKAQDINNMFRNPEIKAIFAVAGGADSNSTFEYLDYDLIKSNPKILCGFSDITSITNIITEKTGLITYNGPTFKALTSWETAYGYEQVIKRFVEGSKKLGEPDDEFDVIRNGYAEGQLVGGNLSRIANLSSGTYSVTFEDKILFIEELYFESPTTEVNYNLYRMKQNGVFNKIKGIWVGNYEGEVALEKILLDVIGESIDVPIIKSNNFGHIDKKVVIPVGGTARIDTNSSEIIELV